MTVLVIDAGSSSVRVLLTDQAGKPLPGGVARRDHQFDAHATADAIHLRELTEACIDDALKHPQAHTITAVGMAVFVGNLLGVDDNGTPHTRLLTYADTRSHPDAAALRDEYDLATVHQRTGCRIHAAYHPAKLRWLHRTQSQTVARVRQWTDFATYCYRVWFGRAVPCSYSVAAWSGLFDRHALVWDTAWLAALGLSVDDLPPLADFDASQTGLAPAYADRWPAVRGIPFYLAVGDGAAANIGSGGTDTTRPVLTVGTTAALRVVTEHPGLTPTGLWAYRVDARRHLVGGATSEGGNIFAWARHTLRLNTAAIDRELIQRVPGSHQLTALPLLAGERSPGYIAEATGTLHGLQLTTSGLDILHALLEGVALRLRLVYDLMNRPGEIVLAGGGALSASPAWAQIIADALRVPLHLVDAPEATGRGVALLVTGQSAAPPIARTIAPRPQYADHMHDLLDRHRQFYRSLWGE
jgi:gluconokinase